jgi:hypothetical protein
MQRRVHMQTVHGDMTSNTALHGEAAGLEPKESDNKKNTRAPFLKQRNRRPPVRLSCPSPPQRDGGAMLSRPEDGVFILYLLLHALLLARSWLCARKHADKAGFLALVSGGGAACLGVGCGRQRSCWAPGHATSARPMVPILSIACRIVSHLQGTRCDSCGPAYVRGGETCWGNGAAVRAITSAEGDSFANYLAETPAPRRQRIAPAVFPC